MGGRKTPMILRTAERDRLFQAVKGLDIDALKACYKEYGNAITETRDRTGNNPLRLAIEFDFSINIDVIRYLVDCCGANLESVDNFDTTALFAASHYGNLKAVQYFVENCRVDVEARCGLVCESTALQRAASKGRLEIVKFLVEQGKADVYAACVRAGVGSEWFPLHSASFNNHLGVVKYLTDVAGVDLKVVEDRYGQTAFHMAALTGSFETLHFFVEKCRHLDTMDLVNTRDRDGLTPLHHACKGCWKNPAKIVECLVEKGCADLEIKCRRGWTPLHYAIRGEGLVIAEYLLEKGANVNAATGDEGCTALHIVCTTRRSPELARRLLHRMVHEFGANLTALDRNGWTALHIACHWQIVDMARFLVHEVALLCVVDSSGVMNLMTATDKKGRTPLHLACLRDVFSNRTSVALVLFCLEHVPICYCE